DSAALIGGFNSESFVGAPPANFLGIFMEGPSRVGHYFRPAVAASNGWGRAMGPGPIIRPSGASQGRTLVYDPGDESTPGTITVTLDGESVTMMMPTGSSHATFDRFGVVTFHRGGHHVIFYLDDLLYTSEPSR